MAYYDRWYGENYDRNLSIKDIAKLVRQELKERYPAWKFSVTSGGHQINTLNVTAMEAPVDIFNWEPAEGYPNLNLDKVNGFSREDYKKSNADVRHNLSNINRYKSFEDYSRVNTSWYDNTEHRNPLNKVGYIVMSDVDKLIKSYNYDGSDVQVDYFDRGIYESIDIASNFKVVEVSQEKVAKIEKQIIKNIFTKLPTLPNYGAFPAFVQQIQGRVTDSDENIFVDDRLAQAYLNEAAQINGVDEDHLQQIFKVNPPFPNINKKIPESQGTAEVFEIYMENARMLYEHYFPEENLDEAIEVQIKDFQPANQPSVDYQICEPSDPGISKGPQNSNAKRPPIQGAMRASDPVISQESQNPYIDQWTQAFNEMLEELEPLPSIDAFPEAVPEVLFDDNTGLSYDFDLFQSHFAASTDLHGYSGKEVWKQLFSPTEGNEDAPIDVKTIFYTNASEGYESTPKEFEHYIEQTRPLYEKYGFNKLFFRAVETQLQTLQELENRQNPDFVDRNVVYNQEVDEPDVDMQI